MKNQHACIILAVQAKMERVVLYIWGHHNHLWALGDTYSCLHHFNIDNEYWYAPRHYSGNRLSWPMPAMSLCPILAKSDLDETLMCVSSTLVGNCKRRPVWPTPAKHHLKSWNVYTLLMNSLTQIGQDMNQLSRRRARCAQAPL